MKTPSLGYVIVYVDDVAATLSFYERAFGLPQRFLHESGTYGELETGATALAFAHASMAPAEIVQSRAGGPLAGIELALVVEDVAASFARATGAGAVAVAEPIARGPRKNNRIGCGRMDGRARGFRPRSSLRRTLGTPRSGPAGALATALRRRVLTRISCSYAGPSRGGRSSRTCAT